MPRLLVFVNKVIGRKFRAAYFAWKVLDIEILHGEIPLVRVSGLHSHGVDVPPGNESEC